MRVFIDKKISKEIKNKIKSYEKSLFITAKENNRLKNKKHKKIKIVFGKKGKI